MSLHMQSRSRTTKRSTASSITLKEYRRTVKENIDSMRKNFQRVLELAKVDPIPSTSADSHDIDPLNRKTMYLQDQYEMQARAANIAKCAEAVLKVISHLRHVCCLSDIAYINRMVSDVNASCRENCAVTDRDLMTLHVELGRLRDDMQHDYYHTVYRDDMQHDYYHTVYRDDYEKKKKKNEDSEKQADATAAEDCSDQHE